MWLGRALLEAGQTVFQRRQPGLDLREVLVHRTRIGAAAAGQTTGGRWSPPRGGRSTTQSA
jgi:hypothetical protein